MKSTLKLFLVVCLFSSVTFAGDMGDGGRSCTENCQVSNNTPQKAEEENSVLSFIQDYLISIFG